MLQCPKCQKNIVDTAADGTRRLRSKLILFKEDGAVALCPSCKEEVPIPLTLGHVEKPLQKPTEPLYHYIRTVSNKG